ncbi:MAG: hypothetical protein ACYCYR_10640 [Desulfobulbaceae bacterium]
MPEGLSHFPAAFRGARRDVVLSLIFLFLFAGESAGAFLTVRSRTAVDLKLVGYNGLEEIPLASKKVPARGSSAIETPYSGLAMLMFSEGQSYPVILQDISITLNIEDPSSPPSFPNSKVNKYFYGQLIGEEDKANTSTSPDDFARLMIQAKQLLESTQPTRTIAELTAKKEEFHKFVRDNYASLSHSDMLRRLVAQYFMMHEYVDYRAEETLATDIRASYHQAVVDGIGNWLAILGPHIPEHEILNYCLSLYYQRSMVTIAALIVENFQSAAYCPGVEKEIWSFPKDLLVTEANGHGEKQLGTIKAGKIIAFVSDDCPVSMVATVIKARQLADQNKGVQLIVAPLQQLSEAHLLMNRMVSNGNMLFINDEQWRKENLARKIKLPLFVPLGNDLSLPDRIHGGSPVEARLPE